MYTSISQPIDVLAVFRGRRVEPMTFKWGLRHVQVKKVNLMHSERSGREKIVYFSVTDHAGNAYRLSYSSETMGWRLEDLATV